MTERTPLTLTQPILDALLVGAKREAAKAALAEAADLLQAKAVAEADTAGRLTLRSAAIWDAAAWLREDAFNEVTGRTPTA